MAPAGRRPAGARMPTPPPQPAPVPSSNFESRPKTTRLNLLNPMSLLARRRSSQAVSQTSPPATNATSPVDPSIRGTRVHDFDSAPRPRRNVSYNDVHDFDAKRSPNPDKGELSPWSGGLHTPVFTEDFEEEQYPASGPHVRKASDLSDLPLPQPPYAISSRRKSSPASTDAPADVQLPVIAWNSPIDPPPVPPKSPEPEPRRISLDATPPLQASPPSIKTRSRNVSGGSTRDFLINGAVKPRHMKSTSSRFSFDMIGAAKQEKLLEDRHRQKELERQNASPTGDDEGQFDDFDYDGMLDDDGLEERIPGVNADAEDDDDYYANLEEDIPGVNADLEDEEAHDLIVHENVLEEEEISGVNVDESQGVDDESTIIMNTIEGFTFHSLGISTATSPLSPLSHNAVSTPRDANGEVIGFALSKESPGLPPNEDISPGTKSTSPTLDNPVAVKPERRQYPQRKSSLFAEFPNTEPLNLAERKSTLIADPLVEDELHQDFDVGLDDDMYFDDGMIDLGEDEREVHEFDESVFDNDDTDQYGRPLRPLSSLPTLYSPPSIKPEDEAPPNRRSREPLRLSTPSTKSVTFESSAPINQSRVDEEFPVFQQPVSLTHDTLTAYQSALAAAALQAEANGRFRRESASVEDRDDLAGLSQNFDNDDFDYEDALDDDAIIAEANAEALAVDDDGFYGQEFGFYSTPAASEALYSNGGYFGPRGGDGLIRSQSGRVVREPNLTPITERSEYSNRNSLMSLPLSAHGHLASPNLAQLMGEYGDHDDDNMSLSALLKMRRGAWGGSQASVRSSNGDGSPLDAVAEESPSSLFAPSHGQNKRRNSGFSVGMNSETSSAPASPTLTLANMGSIQTTAPPSSMLNSLYSRPLSPKFAGVGMVDSRDPDRENAFGRQGRSHRHTGSADSISYVKEDDPVAGERWVLERRRTAESGEIEVLGRQVVSGGRI